MVGSDVILGWYKGPIFEIPKWWQIDKQTNRQTDFPLVDSVGGVKWKYLLRKVDWRCWVQVWIISGLLNRHQFIKNTTLFIWTRLKQIHHMAVFQVSFEDCQKLEMVVFILPCVCNLSWPGSAYPEPDSEESLETYTKPGACGEASKNCITLPCPDQLTTHRYFLNFFSPKDSLSLNQENRLSG